ncbi:hypothetical protein FQN54_002134 [Arachnomyces sp. PD_36]|nr:hypothetical protein FQN54_002134 [Arachnomyces sp. PD_36]
MDLVDHFKQEVEFEEGCTIHVEYRSDRSRGVRREKVLKRWYREQRIGFGAFGDIWLEEQRDGDEVKKRAVKIIDKDKMKYLQVDYKKELLALAKLSKEQYLQDEVFVEFFGWFEDVSNVYLLMENLELRDLERHITDSITEDEVRDITTDVLNGLRIMHAEKFAHRDLKPGNIFVVQKPPEHKWSVKIGDFGISKRVHDATELRTMVGTPHYTAPEITGDVDTDEPTSVYDHFVDMWSLGCVIYKVATQKVIFDKPRDLKRFCSGRARFPAEPLLAKMSMEGLEFVKNLVVPNPRGRLSAEDALEEPWVSQGKVGTIAEHDEREEPFKHGRLVTGALVDISGEQSSRDLLKQFSRTTIEPVGAEEQLIEDVNRELNGPSTDQMDRTSDPDADVEIAHRDEQTGQILISSRPSRGALDSIIEDMKTTDHPYELGRETIEHLQELLEESPRQGSSIAGTVSNIGAEDIVGPGLGQPPRPRSDEETEPGQELGAEELETGSLLFKEEIENDSLSALYAASTRRMERLNTRLRNTLQDTQKTQDGINRLEKQVAHDAVTQRAELRDRGLLENSKQGNEGTHLDAEAKAKILRAGTRCTMM